MDCTPSDDQQELVATVRGLLAKRAGSAAVRACFAADPGYDVDLWRTLADQVGVAALAVPEAHDGVGASVVETLLVLEELGRCLAPSPLLASVVTAEVLLATATDEARARLLPRIAAGEVAAFVDGTGSPVLDGHDATVLVAVVGDELVEVDPTTATRTRRGTVDQTLRLADIDLAGATSTVIGEAEPARRRADLVGAAAVAALATGLAARGLEMTVAYSKEREQFGRAIGSFQALKHRMADMLVLTEMSRSASWAASYAVAHHTDDAERLAHVAKAYCTDAAAHVAAETVQLHGGIAITWEHDAHLVLKRAHALGQLFGSSTAHRRAVEL